jgi:hypothetical protein
MNDIYDLEASKIVSKCRNQWRSQAGRHTATALDALLVHEIAHALRNAAQPSLLEAEESD